ncbi:hypothetical protein [Microcoleus sp. FACHB-1515]|nr:hypothetical protein [Microcoleus sp. FACHB-1515]
MDTQLFNNSNVEFNIFTADCSIDRPYRNRDFVDPDNLAVSRDRPTD